MWYMNQALVILVRFSLQDPRQIHCKEAAKLCQHWGPCRCIREFVALSLSPLIFLVIFEPGFCFQTGLT